MSSILDLLPPDALVLRDGSQMKIPSTNLVVGDIVKIQVRNKVPADLRLLSTSGDIRSHPSMLSGESDEIEGAIEMTSANFLESRNITLTGTMVRNGSGNGIVVLTAGNTVMGRIAKVTTSVKDVPFNSKNKWMVTLHNSYEFPRSEKQHISPLPKGPLMFGCQGGRLNP